MFKKIIKYNTLFFYFSIFFLFLSSCSPRYSYHGNYFSAKEINFLKKTRLSKAEILQVMGAPSTKTTFSDNVWYYITQVRKERAYFSVDNMSTTVLKIAFDKNNIVKSYKVYSDEFSIDVEINSAKTSTVLEKDENFMKALFSSYRRRLLNPIK